MSRLRKTNRYFFVPGMGAKTLIEWSELTGVKPNLILFRLNEKLKRLGLKDFRELSAEDVKECIFTPPRPYRVKRAREGHAARHRTSQAD